MVGFFGKLPASGDFVARGLDVGVRLILDKWISQHLAMHARQPESWPELGVRAALDGWEHPLALVAVPSRDLAGRCFPLVAVSELGNADQMSVDIWADKVLPMLWDAIDRGHDANQLVERFVTLGSPAPAASMLQVPLVWSDEVAPEQPKTAVERIFDQS